MSHSVVLASLYLGLAVLAILLVGCSASRPEGTQFPPDLINRGAVLYNANCLSCHGGATGGKMTDVPPPHNAQGHTWHHSDCQIEDIVLHGSGEMGEMMRQMMGVPEDTPRMPAFKEKLTEEEVAAILAYIKTWWTGEQRGFQAKVTEAQC